MLMMIFCVNEAIETNVFKSINANVNMRVNADARYKEEGREDAEGGEVGRGVGPISQ